MKSKRIITALLALALIFTFIPVATFASGQMGVVNSHVGSITLRVRSGPGTNFSQVQDSGGNNVSLTLGTFVTIIETVDRDPGDRSDSQTWYKISASFNGENIIGYSASSYIDIIDTQSSKAMISSDPSEPLRNGAGTSYPKVNDISLNFSTIINIQSSSSCTDGSSSETWYYVSCNYNGQNVEGFVPASAIKMAQKTTDNGGDISFEEALSQFPESYRPALIELHNIHPNWRFEPVKADEDWKAVMKGEMKPGNNMTDSSNQSLRSTDSECYDWAADKFKAFDSNSWYQVKQEVLEYYMDPRNFLTEDKIFQFEALSFNPLTQTASGVNKIIEKSFMNNASTPAGNDNISYTEGFLRAAEISGVSPYHLASKVIQEVGNSGSGSTNGNYPGYEGYYTFYNINAYSSDRPIANAMEYAKKTDEETLRPWNTPLKSIIGGAVWIGRSYINKGQNTIYLEKYDITDDGNGLYYHQYMTNVSGAYTEGRKVYNAYKSMGILDTSMTFRIPVFDNMPSSPRQLTTKTGNPNNVLSSLSVDGISLNPDFEVSPNKTNYYIILQGQSSVNISATTVNPNATISGDIGEIQLEPYMNKTLRIRVKAENGDTRDYKINISWESENGLIYGDVNGDNIVSDKDATLLLRYVGGIWKGVHINTDTSDLNYDGEVNDKDSILLLRYVGESWKITLGKPKG